MTPHPPRVHPVVRWLSLLYLVPRREWLRRRLGKSVLEQVGDLDIVVPKGVFNPVLFRTGRFFADFIANSPACDPVRFSETGDARALDCTTGTGIQALMLARRGFRVTAVDVNPHAVRAARSNAVLNDSADRVEVIEGDLFEPVHGRKFDLVVSALPLFRGEAQSGFELSWRSPDVIERFADGLSAALAPGGEAMALFTTDGDQDGFFRALERNGFDVSVLTERHFGNEIITIYRLKSSRVSDRARAEP